MLKILLNNYLEYLKTVKNRSPKTIENYDHYLRKFLQWSEIETPEYIADIVIQGYLIYLENLKNSQDKPLNIKTKNYYLIALRGFLKYIKQQNIYIPIKPKIQLYKTPRQEISFLKANELEKFLSAPQGQKLKNLRDKAIIELLISTGIRVAELCSLQREQISLTDKKIVVPKNKAWNRYIPLTNPAAQAAQNYLNERKDSVPFLFINLGRGKKSKKYSSLTPRSVQRIIRYYAIKAGIDKKISPSILRRSFAAHLLLKGTDIKTAQKILGHSHISSTKALKNLLTLED